MTTLSTHVLDTANGHPAEGLTITLAKADGDGWNTVATGTTDADGRVADLAAGADIAAGSWRLTFSLGDYFDARGQECFYDDVDVAFRLGDDGHYHVPLLASPWGYSTYRGS